MPLIIPNTFNAGDTIEANLVQENMNGVQEYVNGKIDTADIADGFETRHLMRGEYNPITNQLSLITGIMGGQTYSTAQSTFTGLCAPPSGEWDGTGTVQSNILEQETDVSVANTGITFYMAQAGDVFFQFQGTPLSSQVSSLKDATKGGYRRSRFYIYLDGVKQSHTMMTTFDESTGPMKCRHPISSFWYYTDLPAGFHTFDIKGFTDTRYSLMFSWSVTLEAWYQLPAGTSNPNNPPDEPS
jgi:hypothetical protein